MKWNVIGACPWVYLSCQTLSQVWRDAHMGWWSSLSFLHINYSSSQSHFVGLELKAATKKFRVCVMAEIRTTHRNGYLSNQNPIETFLFLQLNSTQPFPFPCLLSRQVPSVKLEMTISVPRLVNTKANAMDLPRNCVSKKCQICGSNNHQTRVCCHFSPMIYAYWLITFLTCMITELSSISSCLKWS
jgi:hypothetical protein